MIKLPLTPITDRTEADQRYAYENQGATEDLKGAINASDLNRIETNTKFLVDELAKQNYRIVFVERPSPWKVNENVYQDDFDRLRQNALNLAEGFAIYANSSQIAPGWERTSIAEANALEDLLSAYEGYLNLMIGLYRKSDTFKSGQETIRAPEDTMTGDRWMDRDALDMTWAEIDARDLTAFMIDYRGYGNV